MKRVCSLMLGVLLISASAMSQLAFTVKPGLTLNGGSFGVKFGNILLFGGLDYMRVSTSVETSGNDAVSTAGYIGGVFTYGYRLEAYSDKYEAALNVYAPTVGARIYLGGPEKVSAYVSATVTKPLIMGTVEEDGKGVESVQDYLDNISLWGFQAGFGAEYFFNDSFSLGGEFGFRLILASYEEESKATESVFVGTWSSGRNQNVETTRKYDLSAGLGLTYSALTLNYYF